MALTLTLAAILLAPVVLLGTAGRLTRAQPSDPTAPGFLVAARHARWTRVFAVSIAILVAASAEFVPWPMSPGADGVTTLVAPALLGLTGLGIIAWRESHHPLVTTPVRHASLTRRHMRDFLSPFPTALVGLTAASLVGLAVVGTITAAPDGRSLATRTTLDDGTIVHRLVGPWPGAHFAVPLLVVLTVEIGVAALTAHRITSRHQTSTTADGGLDAALRRCSMTGVMGFLLVSIGILALGFGLASALVLAEVVTLGTRIMTVPAILAAGLGLASLVTGVLSLMGLPAPRTPGHIAGARP